MISRGRRAHVAGGDEPGTFRSTEELRREAAELLARSPWWAEQVRRERQAIADGVGDELRESAAAVCVTDLKGIVVDWNRGAERLYGWSRDEMLGRPIGDLSVGPDDLAFLERLMETLRRTGMWEGEAWVRCKDGDTILATFRDTLVTDADGIPIGLLGVSLPARRGGWDPA